MTLACRSLLFMPADNVRAHEKAAGLAADGLIFDLEDAVSPAHKAAARDAVVQSAARFDYGDRPLFLRMNHPDSDDAKADIATLACLPHFAGVVIPKAEDARSVAMVDRWMHEAGCPAHQRIAIMLETPRGILNAQSIAEDGKRLCAVIAGTNDLGAELHLPAQQHREGLLHALSHIVLVARAYGLAAFDGVYNRLRDETGFAEECAQGRQLGFDGKTLIHPAQVDAANTAFSPTEAEYAAAQALIAQWEAQDKGVTTASGAMIEELHIRNARRILALAARHKSAMQE